MMSLNPKLGGCPYGDKEFYWLGQSYSGLKYEFEPFRAAMLEFPWKEYSENGHYVKTTLCNDHIAHTHENNLVWVNGGMKRFKYRGGGEDGVHNPPMEANGFIISDRKHGSLQRYRDKFGPACCGACVEVGGEWRTLWLCEMVQC